MAVLGLLQGQSERSHTFRPVPPEEIMQNKRIKKDKQMKHDPIECEVCGTIFIPSYGRRTLCDTCQQLLRNGKGRKIPETREGPTDVARHEKEVRKRYMERYHDTIVAEGYADRQRAKTLAMVGKVRVEL